MHEIDLKSIEAKHMFQTTLFGFEEFLNRFPSDAFNSVAVKKNLQIKKPSSYDFTYSYYYP